MVLKTRLDKKKSNNLINNCQLIQINYKVMFQMTKQRKNENKIVNNKSSFFLWSENLHIFIITYNKYKTLFYELKPKNK